MVDKRHKNNTKKFSELNFEEQAKSINALINNLQRSISFHIQNSKNPNETKTKCLKQLNRLNGRLL